MELRLTNRLDNTIITAATTLPITLVQEYSNGISESVVVDVKAFSGTEVTAFALVMDALTINLEQDAKIFTITETAKVFNLENSYVRSAKSTAGTITAIPTGTPLIVQIETPGFTVFNVFELSLWYNQVFNPTELSALRDLGIIVIGNGAEFTVDNSVQCRVYFKKPDAIRDPYIINNAALNQIIPV